MTHISERTRNFAALAFSVTTVFDLAFGTLAATTPPGKDALPGVGTLDGSELIVMGSLALLAGFFFWAATRPVRI